MIIWKVSFIIIYSYFYYYITIFLFIVIYNQGKKKKAANHVIIEEETIDLTQPTPSIIKIIPKEPSKKIFFINFSIIMTIIYNNFSKVLSRYYALINTNN